MVAPASGRPTLDRRPRTVAPASRRPGVNPRPDGSAGLWPAHIGPPAADGSAGVPPARVETPGIRMVAPASGRPTLDRRPRTVAPASRPPARETLAGPHEGRKGSRASFLVPSLNEARAQDAPSSQALDLSFAAKPRIPGLCRGPTCRSSPELP